MASLDTMWKFTVSLLTLLPVLLTTSISAQDTTETLFDSYTDGTYRLLPTSDIGLTSTADTADAFLPAATVEPPDYTLGILRMNVLSPSDQKHIAKLAVEGNISIGLIELKDFPYEDVSSFRKVLHKLRKARPNAVIGQYKWAYAVATEHLRIPYLVTSMTPQDQPKSPFLIQLFPSIKVFARATEDVLEYYKLTKVAVFYDREEGGVVLERLAHITWMEVTGVHVTEGTVSNLRQELKIIRANYFSTIVTVLSPHNTRLLLDQGLSLSMFSPPNRWLLLNLGLEEFTLEDYVDSRANITVLRLMMDFDSEYCNLGQDEMGLEAAAYHDAIQLFHHVEEARDPTSRRVSMRKTIRNLKLDGCTGQLNFTKFGIRMENFLQVITLQGYLTGQSGTWRSEPTQLNKRMEPFRSYSAITREAGNVFPDRPLRITIRGRGAPFTNRKSSNSLESGHPEFEGFCIDIFLEMAKLLGIRYNITAVWDNKFGSWKPAKGHWTGMIRELVNDRADIALAPFQMSTERASVVDFTKPFMTKGTTVMVKRPEYKVWMFHFLSPFTAVVWTAIFIAFIGTSLTLFGVSRINSDCHAKYAHNLRESFWYIWGTLLRGSLSGSPHAISSRIVSSAWWFFALIISSIYTANLAAFLTITINDVGINNAADLANQDKLDYGTVEDSQTEKFFVNTNMSQYSRMWVHMSSNTSSVRRVEDGFRRVAQGGYAFIWDTPDIRYEISNSCTIMEVGSPFDLKGYGFAYKKNAPYGEKLSWALLTLQDNGVLYKLERKWWRPQVCPSPKQSAQTKSLDVDTTAGMYIIILAGAIISFIVCVLQIFYARHEKKELAKKRNSAEGMNGGDTASPSDHSSRSLYPSRHKMGDGDNDLITYANHSPAHYASDDWKLKYDSY